MKGFMLPLILVPCVTFKVKITNYNMYITVKLKACLKNLNDRKIFLYLFCKATKYSLHIML